MRRGWIVAGVLTLVAVPSVPVAAAGVSLVLERVNGGAEDVGKWVRTGDVQRFRVRLNGMGKGAKVAVAANPVEALTEVTCAAGPRAAAGGGQGAGSAATGPGAGSGVSAVSGAAVSDPGTSGPGVAGGGTAASGVASSDGVGLKVAGRLAARALIAAGAAEPNGPLSLGAAFTPSARQALPGGAASSGAASSGAASSGAAPAGAPGGAASGGALGERASSGASPHGTAAGTSLHGTAAGAGASGPVPAGPSVGATAPEGAVVPGARVCALGKVSGTKAVDVTVRAPEGSERVVVAAVARVRDGGKPTTMSRTAAVRVRGPITGDAATFSGPAHRVPGTEPRTAQGAPRPATPRRDPARATGAAQAEEERAARTGDARGGAVRTGRAHVAATPRDAGRDVSGARPGKRTRTSTGASPGGRTRAGAANAARTQRRGGTANPGRTTRRGGTANTGKRARADAAALSAIGTATGDVKGHVDGGANGGAARAVGDAGALKDAGTGTAGGVRTGATGEVTGAAPGLVLPEAVPGGATGTGGVPGNVTDGASGNVTGGASGNVAGGVPGSVTGGGAGATGPAQSGSGRPAAPGAAGDGAAGGAGGHPAVAPSVAQPGSPAGDAGGAGTLPAGEAPWPWEMGVRAKPAKPIAWVSPIDGPKAFPLVVASIAVLMCGLWLVVTVQKRRNRRKVL